MIRARMSEARPVIMVVRSRYHRRDHSRRTLSSHEATWTYRGLFSGWGRYSSVSSSSWIGGSEVFIDLPATSPHLWAAFRIQVAVGLGVRLRMDTANLDYWFLSTRIAAAPSANWENICPQSLSCLPIPS